jgi:hypothetical protein
MTRAAREEFERRKQEEQAANEFPELSDVRHKGSDLPEDNRLKNVRPAFPKKTGG